MSNTIEKFIDAVAAEDFRAADAAFQELIGAKVADTLDAARVDVATATFGAPEIEGDENGDPDAE